MKEPFLTPELIHQIVDTLSYVAAAFVGWVARMLQIKKRNPNPKSK